MINTQEELEEWFLNYLEELKRNNHYSKQLIGMDIKKAIGEYSHSESRFWECYWKSWYKENQYD